MPYREKRIVSGNMLEVEIYPITNRERRKSRGRKKKESRIAQKNLNDKNAKKHLVRLVNANFTDKDLYITTTYDDENLPNSEEEAQKDIRNYIRRLKGYRKRRGMPDMKYIAVVEYREKTEGKAIRIHHHIIMDGEVDRDTVERLWKKGRCNAQRLQANEFGYEEVARYIAKDPKGKKRWIQSKNLKQPEVKINDYKYSKRKVKELFMEKENRQLFQELYKGYIYTDCKTYISDYTGEAIYLKMRRLN